jgi:signal peptidase I
MEGTLLVGDFLLVNKFIYGATLPFVNWKLPAAKAVEAGDVVVFKFPRDKDVNYIKRCAAVSGQTIEIKNKIVFVDGVEVVLPEHGKVGVEIEPTGKRDNAIFPREMNFNRDNYGAIRVPKAGDKISLNDTTFHLYKFLLEYEGRTASLMGGQVYLDGKPISEYIVQQNYFFMLGDNRDNSLDSRYWGFLPESNIVGLAIVVYWSWSPELPVANIVEKMRSIRWERIGRIIH